MCGCTSFSGRNTAIARAPFKRIATASISGERRSAASLVGSDKAWPNSRASTQDPENETLQFLAAAKARRIRSWPRLPTHLEHLEFSGHRPRHRLALKGRLRLAATDQERSAESRTGASGSLITLRVIGSGIVGLRGDIAVGADLGIMLATLAGAHSSIVPWPWRLRNSAGVTPSAEHACGAWAASHCVGFVSTQQHAKQFCYHFT